MSSAGQQLVAGRIPGEQIARQDATSDSATFTGTEVELQTVTAAVVSGRTYKIVYDWGCEITIDGSVRSQVRLDTVSGTIIGIRDTAVDASTTVNSCRVETFWTATSTTSQTFSGTGRVTGGGGTANRNADATFPSFMYVEYVSG